MSNNETFSVATIGIDEKKSEMNVLQSVLIISQNRTPKFELHDTAAKKNPPAVVVVNSDDVEAIEKWHAYELLHKDKSSINAIMIGSKKPDECEYFLARPLIATRLLALLEKVVTEKNGYVPAGAFEETLSGQSAKEKVSVASGKDGISALVVDDSLPIRTQLKMALENMGSDVDFAENGDDALEFVKSKNYDIVFLDVVLPGVDGYEICKIIKQDPDKRNTPVIMLTSNTSPADRVKGKLAGCDTYLIKPVQLAVFEEVVSECLSASAA